MYARGQACKSVVTQVVRAACTALPNGEQYLNPGRPRCRDKEKYVQYKPKRRRYAATAMYACCAIVLSMLEVVKRFAVSRANGMAKVVAPYIIKLLAIGRSLIASG